MKGFSERLFNRLSNPAAFGWPTFWLSLSVYFGTTILFDARRFGGPTGLWLLSWLIGHLLMLGWVLVFQQILLNRLTSRKWRIVSVLAVGTSAGLIRGFFIGSFTVFFELASEPQWMFRLVGGSLAGFVLTIAGAGLSVAAIEHQRIVSELEQTRERLLTTRTLTPKLLRKTQKDIARLASKAILPKLETIERALTTAGAPRDQFLELASQIRALINQEVRPKSSALYARVEAVVNTKPLLPVRKIGKLGLPTRVDLTVALSPGVILGIALMLSLATFAPLTDPGTTALSLIGALLIWVTVLCSRFALAKAKEVSLWSGTVILGSIGAISTIPLSVITQWSLPRSLNLSAMPIQSASTIAVLVVGVGYTRIVDSQRARFEKELLEFNATLERELKWIDAQVWIIRREWAYLLHGRVQSALTAALARIGDGSYVPAETLHKVQEDISRARAAIYGGITAGFDLSDSLKELEETWEGICAIELEIESEAFAAVQRDLGLARAVNEIVRECVSNAVRHGSASRVKVELANAEAELRLRVTNNGSPVTRKTRASLGSEMMNSLSINWSLRNARNPASVVVSASLAKANSS